MHLFKKTELNTAQLDELKSQWFSIEEAIEELAIDGVKLTESLFRKEAKLVNINKEFAQIGKPQVKDEKLDGKGRPRKVYNRAFVEALRSFAISDTYKKVEEQPIDFFISSDWRKEIEEEFNEILIDYIKGPKELDFIVDQLSRIVGENIIQKQYGLITQNKLLVHQNKKLEDTKEYYIALNRGVEENANVLNDIANFIKSDISDSSALLSRKEAYHSKLTININQKLEEIMKVVEDIKRDGK